MVHRICAMPGDEGTFVLCVVLQALSSAAFGLLIGAVVPSAEAAMALGPPLMLVLTIVGAVISVALIPSRSKRTGVELSLRCAG
jgi:hypothetical protein